MKNMAYVFKWMLGHSKSYISNIFLILVLGTATSFVSVYRVLISKTLIDSATSSNTSLMLRSLTLLGILLISELCFESLKSVLSVKSHTNLTASIQKKVYNHVIHSNWLEQSKYHSGSLLTRLTSDVGAVANVIIHSLPNTFSLLVLLSTSYVVLFKMEPKLGAMVLIISPLSILFSRLYAKRIKKIYKDAQEADAKSRSFMQESIQNLLIIKTFCRENENLNSLTEIQNNKISLAMKRSYISIISNFILHLGSWSVFFLVFFWGSKNLSNGTATFGTLTALLQLVGNIQAPIRGLASTLPELIAAVGSSERIIEILNLPTDKISSLSSNNIHQNTSCSEVRFRTVQFSYKKEKSFLENISFNISSGETIGLVGKSGEGKTTIIRLLLGIINPDEGEILMKNNNEFINVSSTTRNYISYVPQGNTLFSGTIKDNLLFGNPDATDAEITEAINSSYAWSFINDFKDKLHTVIGEKGVGLSEGQAQRLAIARAFLRKKPVLILDEATSSLDIETEVRILNSIRNLSYKPMCVIITHRPSALSICDRVFKLQNGNLMEVVKDVAISLESDIQAV
jgi:ATP-binding cassette, subfamily B, bacterial